MEDKIIDDYKKTIERLQQECIEKTDMILEIGEELQAKKEKVKKLEESAGFWGRTTSRVQSERDKYKQALKEIKEIAAINDINTCWTVITNCEQCSDSEECGMQNPITRLNIIYKKCEELENEHL